MSAAHVAAGRRGQTLRREAVDRLRYEVERMRPELLALYDAHSNKVPRFPANMSRMEWFEQWADEQGEAVQWDAAQSKADHDVADMVADYMRGAA